MASCGHARKFHCKIAQEQHYTFRGSCVRFQEDYLRQRISIYSSAAWISQSVYLFVWAILPGPTVIEVAQLKKSSSSSSSREPLRITSHCSPPAVSSMPILHRCSESVRLIHADLNVGWTNCIAIKCYTNHVELKSVYAANTQHNRKQGS